MFSRLITRSIVGSRRVATFKPMGGNVMTFSTKKSAGTPPPPPPQQPPKSNNSLEKEWEELEKYDTNQEIPADVLKSLENSRLAQKKQYQEIISSLMESKETSKISSPKFEVKPTIIIPTASGKVARALFACASQARSLNIVSKDVDMILKAFDTIPSFRSIVEEPDIANADKQNLIDFFVDSVTLSPIGEFFLYYMSNENNFGILVNTLKDFQRLVASLSTEMNIRLTVAHEYNDKEKQQLEQLVRSYFTEDTKIQFAYSVDASIKSGYKIESPLLNHNATLSAAIEKSEREEKAIFSDFFNDLREAAVTDTPVWDKNEFKEKYFSFDVKAYEDSLNKSN
ncbi:mitochondrial F1 complex ATP synthase [Heterostelium album PN500]|uniref:Mitochondrial F1 complex ATP synthase n=1 Tax=Heterostelium pallidum (strain ATCC 26659 / Pp 5 / PN500) TaxID=670386 RepID=D3BCJ9_HETP5|nr:mitochondrial F1 complex ATP synthase [Heterostelium album PN500]EFA80641.1 mitochondrial F1 complex ATP synthase [Heterostelium album PN500]|eukprot:XP_020432761.1 mitochondrial F1 complex ATP synthase [Heterostelium album PN500]